MTVKNKIFLIKILLGYFLGIYSAYQLSLWQEKQVRKRLVGTLSDTLPKDLYNLLRKDISYTSKYTKVTEYDMASKDKDRTLTYAANLGGSYFEGADVREDLNGKKWAYFFDTKFWYSTKECRASLDVSKFDEYRYTAPIFFNVPKNSSITIDGPNKDNYIIVGWTNKIDSNIFVIPIQTRSYGTGYADVMPPYKKPILQVEKKYVTAVMIHPIQNSIAYATIIPSDDSVKKYDLHIVEHAYPALSSYSSSWFSWLPWFDNEIEEPSIKQSPFDYYSVVDFGIKKITFFGGGTYLFLTLSGQLGMCWLTQNEQGQKVIECSLKRHASTFIDFTPDATDKTKSGFIRHWAFLNNKGEIFECQFLLPFWETTLFFTVQALDPSEGEVFDRIYFHDNRCGVVYKNIDQNKQVSYTKLVLYS
ncbi:MAG TPA: hypothetical protein VL201_03665 [Patescibacteria group bacterium]|jgi:hypothetical protein|nr:hypothetical protein [Patescibacteria group bacterium]